MLAIGVELLAGRYHATPWGRAANEGDVEWPPSPWRLGRALVDAWYRTPAPERPAEDEVNQILSAMSDSPRFVLPRATVGHSRHYMPLSGHGPRTETRLVLDAFVRVDDAPGTPPIAVVWDDLDLEPRCRSTLADLLGAIGYLGRAEAPALLRLLDDVPSGGVTASPLGQDGDVPFGAEVVQTLGLRPGATIAGLSVSTAELRKRRLPGAPDGELVTYLRSSDALRPTRPGRRPRPSTRVQAVRYAFHGAALPSITDALLMGELVRAAALRRVDDELRDSVALLRGREDGSGEPGRGHRHCHYLTTDEDGDGRVDHLTVWCQAGLGHAELDALDISRLSSSWRLDAPIQVVPLSVIRSVDDAVRMASGPEANRALGPLGKARAWESHTPFLPVHHPKRRAGRVIDGYEDQVRLELRRRGLQEPASVEPLRTGRRHWGSFRRERQSGRRSATVPAAGFRLVFTDPVQGPIALGRNSHFGMGLFLPTTKR